MKKIKVLLADNQPLTRIGLKALLRETPDVSVIDEAYDMDELDAKLMLHKPELLITDYQGICGLAPKKISELKKASKHTEILIITDDNDKTTILKFLQSGVKGFLTKTCSQREITEAAITTANGHKFFCSTVLDILLNQHTLNEEENTGEQSLSRREKQVLKLIAEGHTTKKIADSLTLSPHTINSHRKNIIKKLGIKSPSEFVINAINMSLITT